jgi:tetratricopeptide (TPR) repeat protein
LHYERPRQPGRLRFANRDGSVSTVLLVCQTGSQSANMWYFGSRIGVIGLLAVLSAGCRLPGQQGPVPQSLADCRRLSQRGVAALERGEQAEAEPLLAQAVAACPVDAESRRHYAESLWRRGAQQDAIAQLEKAGHLDGEDASLWTRLAEMHLAAGQPELAWQNVEQALRLDPKLPGAWAVRGAIRRAAGQPGEALADYLHALSLMPNDRAILEEVAEIHRQLNQPDRALQTLQTLADTYSPGEEPGQVLYLMGMAYVAQGRNNEALESYSAAVSRGKPTPDMFYRLAETQLLAGRPAAASDAARQALALQPQHQPSRDLLQRIELANRSQGTVVK